MKEFELQKKYNWELAHEPIGSSNPSASSHYLGEEYLGGIIFNLYTGSDGLEHGLIIYPGRSQEQLKWQNTPTVTGATSSWDGQSNTALITDSPAKDYVTSLGSGWYIPSIDELIIMYYNRFYLNQGFENAGYSYRLNLTNFWSSTEVNPNFAALLIANGINNSGTKTGPQFVTAIKKF